MGLRRVRCWEQPRLSNDHVNTSILWTLVMPLMRHASRGLHKALIQATGFLNAFCPRLQVLDPGGRNRRMLDLKAVCRLIRFRGEPRLISSLDSIGK
jgi:hypothetical protein